jgi:hypothetical protein
MPKSHTTAIKVHRDRIGVSLILGRDRKPGVRPPTTPRLTDLSPRATREANAPGRLGGQDDDCNSCQDVRAIVSFRQTGSLSTTGATAFSAVIGILGRVAQTLNPEKLLGTPRSARTDRGQYPFGKADTILEK